MEKENATLGISVFSNYFFVFLGVYIVNNIYISIFFVVYFLVNGKTTSKTRKIPTFFFYIYICNIAYKIINYTFLCEYHLFSYLHEFFVLLIRSTVCPWSSDPFYIVTYYMKWETTSWTDGKINRTWIRQSRKINQPIGIQSGFEPRLQIEKEKREKKKTDNRTRTRTSDFQWAAWRGGVITLQ